MVALSLGSYAALIDSYRRFGTTYQSHLQGPINRSLFKPLVEQLVRHPQVNSLYSGSSVVLRQFVHRGPRFIFHCVCSSLVTQQYLLEVGFALSVGCEDDITPNIGTFLPYCRTLHNLKSLTMYIVN
jgi:hypothetical protein